MPQKMTFYIYGCRKVLWKTGAGKKMGYLSIKKLINNFIESSTAPVLPESDVVNANVGNA